ncbi:DNA-binding transcriptional regulator, AcrR family [Streptomyces sp. 3213]|uniref:TetR family transcriptional regulator n=1 Tax=Streptomyces sp. 3213.3 TaxID=1855348 RepID=UPI000896432A|nr:TetR family transcriptional regulator [Streptomyces sp. 3213.3]SEE64173.1 DNA-binding transcriptional regulator, AcrR family [Streptomyces sp. 3213] [Streptomyces sp. 3213.3]
MTAEPRPETGLRERKKLRTRYAIISAAVTLFVERGYDETSVAEIAEAAEIGTRTFFRYFATKDEVALALIAEADEGIVRELQARPTEEPPVTALANAARAVVEQLMQADDGTGELWVRIQWLLENSPPLLAAHFQRALSIEDRLARHLAEREGVDPDTDLRPFLTVGTVGTALRAAHSQWSTLSEGTSEDLIRLRDQALQTLHEPLDRHWAHS